ncbi:odorant receptor 45a-like [Musca vetustissima]|uniref:odorant receptor 45a-like n=1 Tax=Musca vetustissima TaxID=27455 RepID=UPI002AB75479|nr:odorant receptor 45a-like [Musca vetustissima]
MSMADRQNLEYLSVQYGAFMALGLDIGVTTGRRRGLLKSVWKFAFNMLCTFYMQYGFGNFVIHSITDIDAITASLSMFNQGILLTFKVSLIILKGEEMLKLIWDMNILSRGANAMEYEKWLSENRNGRLIALGYFYACWAAVTCVAVIPWIFLLYEYFQGMGVNLRLPFQVEFPFDHGGGLLISILNYMCTLLLVHAWLNMSVGIDTLFGWYIFAISGHFRILRNKIKEAAAKIDLHNNHRDFVRDVAAFVSYHNRTLKFVEDLNRLYGEILWGEISMSCLQICFLLYSLANDENFANIPFHFVASAAITMQLMIYCFGGEKLKNENDMLCDDIYMAMPWEKMYPSEKKLMLLPLLRTQKETSLTGLYFIINRNLLVFIFKTAFSFITLLGAIKEI